MGPSQHRRTAHWIRRKAPALAERAVDALYRLRPELETRYGEGGRRHCVKDLGHHLRFLAAAVDMEDPKMFADYALWAAGVMAAHNVHVDDAVASFRALTAVPASLPTGSHDLAGATISAALARLDAWRAAPASRRRPRRRPACDSAACVSTGGSAPSRS